MASRNDILIRILGESVGLDSELKKSSANVEKFSRDVEKSSGRISAFGNVVQGVFQGIGQAVLHSLVGAMRTGVGEISKAIDAASDLNEALNKTNVAFADSSQEILDWSKDSATAFGQSRSQALEAASTFGLLFRTMGVTSDASADMSQRLVELASDLASINNISIDDALVKLRAGLVGEVEPLRTVGVLLNATAVEQKALALGLAETNEAISEQDKAMARYQLILEQTTLAQGDFARTSDELANAQRILDAQTADLGATFGQALLPVQLAFTRGLSELIRVVEPYGLNIMDSLASGLAQGITAILPVLQQVRALFVYWLKPGSPPRLLKELTNWGQSAMEEYLRGWTLADFDALRSVGGLIEDVVRSFSASGDIDEGDLVGRVFGTTRTITEAIREFRTLGQVSENTLSRIADSAGPAGSEVAGLVREYFELQEATQKVADAQNDLNGITDRYADALSPLSEELDAVRDRQREIRENQELQDLGETIADPRAEADERQLARLRVEEIQLERQARAIEDERDTALDAAQKKLDAAKEEENAQRTKYEVAQNALEQQIKTNALIAEEADLRLRVANEALAAQEKATRELEAAQRKAEQTERERQAGLDRITDAQLRYQLASTDTAGQLEIMRGELAKVAEGSAEYYDILTTIIGLEERLQAARDKAGGGLLPTLTDVVGDSAEIEQTRKGIQELSTALEAAFEALAGGDGQTVELAPAWQTFADTLTGIGDVAVEVAPYIQAIIDLVMGKDVAGVEDGAGDPFGDNFWLAGIVPFVRGLAVTLEQLLDGDWSGLWARFKGHVDSTLDGYEGEPGAYTYLRDYVIPLMESLADVEWAEMWGKFTEGATNAWQAVTDFVTARIADITAAVDELKAAIDFLRGIEPDAVPGGGGGGGGGGFGGDGPSGQDYLPPSNFSSFPGASPQVPAFAAGNVSGDTNTYYIEQNIATNGDFGGARQGALEGIRQALIGRRLQGA